MILGRLGCDFTSMVLEIFEPKLVSLVVSQWKEGVSSLEETLKVCRDSGVASPLTSSSIVSKTSSASLEQPPRQLMSNPPLARLTNAYLSGLNELRRCLLPSIFVTLRIELKRSLKTAKTALETNQRAVNAPGLRGEATKLREVAENMIITFENVIEPYLNGAFEVALGDFEAAKELLSKLTEEEDEIEDDAAVQDEENVASEDAVDNESVKNDVEGAEEDKTELDAVSDSEKLKQNDTVEKS